MRRLLLVEPSARREDATESGYDCESSGRARDERASEGEAQARSGRVNESEAARGPGLANGDDEAGMASGDGGGGP